ncbi:MAG: N-acetyltransferase family protein [Candidatus Babeliales bacterium]
MEKIIVRNFKSEDLDELLELYRHTVNTINIRDYSPEQIAVWIPEKFDKEKWLSNLMSRVCFIAQKNNQLVGFGSMTPEGVVYHLYVHKDFQGQKIGSKLLKALEDEARSMGLKQLTTESSITALPFFKAHGYALVDTQEKEYKGMTFVINTMKKSLSQFS